MSFVLGVRTFYVFYLSPILFFSFYPPPLNFLKNLVHRVHRVPHIDNQLVIIFYVCPKTAICTRFINIVNNYGFFITFNFNMSHTKIPPLGFSLSHLSNSSSNFKFILIVILSVSSCLYVNTKYIRCNL